MPAPEKSMKQFVKLIIGIILQHFDFLKDNFALIFDLICRETVH